MKSYFLIPCMKSSSEILHQGQQGTIGLNNIEGKATYQLPQSPQMRVYRCRVLTI
jgi:hypothetical protein